MKVILEKVFREDYKDGTYGKSRKIGIKIANESIVLDNGEEISTTDKWLSTFQGEKQYKEMDAWDAGMEVDITASAKVVGDKTFINFKPLSKVDARLEALEAAVFGGSKAVKKAPAKAKKEEAEDMDW